MKSLRVIEIKTLFNADEYTAFRDECLVADVSHSKQLRDLAKGWVNDRRKVDQRERQGGGYNPAMFLPNRNSYGSQNMRIHV